MSLNVRWEKPMRRACPTLRHRTDQGRLRYFLSRVSSATRAWGTKLSAITRDGSPKSGDTHSIPPLCAPYRGTDSHLQGTRRSCWLIYLQSFIMAGEHRVTKPEDPTDDVPSELEVAMRCTVHVNGPVLCVSPSAPVRTLTLDDKDHENGLALPT